MNSSKLLAAVFFFAAFTISGSVLAQHHETSESHASSHASEHHHGKHKISVYTGFTHVPGAFYEHETHEESTGKWIPTVGLDYFYTLNKRWDAGLMVDGEFDNYYIQTSHEEKLERNNILVIAAVAKYKPLEGLGIIAGPGREWELKEHTESFWVLKTGVEYEIPIRNGWEITPSFIYDWKEEYSAYSYGFSIGKRF